MRRRLVALLCSLLMAVSAFAQQRTKVFISEISGPDAFIAERFRLVFLEELSKLKSIEVTETKGEAQVILQGAGRLDTLQKAKITGAGEYLGASAGDVPNAMLSVKLTDSKTGQILFVGNKSQMGGRKGATQEAVIALVKDMKKRLKWK